MTNRPLHYKSGPFENSVGVVRADGTLYVLPWELADDDIRITESVWGERDNWLQPDKWPRASSGA